MVKLKWPINKIVLQRMILITIIGVISCGILKGHMNYEKEVSEYMHSLEYRRAREASQDYHVKIMKDNQRLFTAEEISPQVNEK